MPYRALFKHMRALFRPVVPARRRSSGIRQSSQDQLRGDRRSKRMLVAVVPGGKTFGRAFHQESTDSRSLQPRPDDGDVGEAAVGHPGLVSVQDETPAVVPCPGPHPSGIRAEIGLGETKAADGPSGCSRGSQYARCSSLPKRWMGYMTRAFWTETKLRRPLSPLSSSCMMRP